MLPLETQLKCLGRILTNQNLVLLERVESLEHLSNQHNILLTTLGDIMKEIENLEHYGKKPNGSHTSTYRER